MTPLRAYNLEPAAKLRDRSEPAGRVDNFRNLIVVIMFSLIGLLLTANLVFRFSDPALTVEQFSTFAGP
jgi:hypothetical protein